MTYINSKSEAMAVISGLTAKYPVCEFCKIGFDSKRLDLMGSAFKNEENRQMNEPSVTFSLIETYNAQFKKVYRVHFNKC